MTQFLNADSYLPPYMAYPRFLLELGIGFVLFCKADKLNKERVKA